ncbi:hypothetical protein HT576_06505 [Haloterrigena sp. SYSU A121-1]|uniref:Uncharacterized protein n=1 Tax=Haloterrigena gelatinilytica TaxID=2741724 RepID=A0A8J8GLK3_9EURY|nr:hypothetical protein [Haloterrigena gelatinilytica]NUB90669.1 hypothetical protein [Haloterrigena gelatinilytica]
MAAEQPDRTVGLGRGLESRRRRLAETVAPLAELPLRGGYRYALVVLRLRFDDAIWRASAVVIA